MIIIIYGVIKAVIIVHNKDSVDIGAGIANKPKIGFQVTFERNLLQNVIFIALDLFFQIIIERVTVIRLKSYLFQFF